MAAPEPIYFKGKDLFVSLNGVMIGCDQSTDIQLTAKMFDNGSKCTVDANGNLFNSMIPTMTTVKFSGNGFTILDITESGGQNERSTASLMDLLINQTLCFASWQRGTKFYGCNVYVSDVKETAKFDEISTYTYTLDGAGPITTIDPS